MEDAAARESLAGSMLCRYLEEGDIDELFQAGRMVEISEGEDLFAEGDPGGVLYVILQGKLKVWVTAGDHRKELAHLRTGEIIGEISLVDASPRSASATASMDTTLYALQRRGLLGMLRSHPVPAAKVLWAIMETVSWRLRNVTEEMVEWEQADHAPKADL